MYTLKGFITNSALTNNAPGVVAQIGELSPISLTYAKDKGLYTSPSSAYLGLTTFTSAMAGVPVSLTTDISDHVLTVAQGVYSYMSAQGQIFADLLLAELLTLFGTLAQNFQCGAIVSDGTHWAPEWISWENTSIQTIATANLVKIWFVDASFQNEYDDYQIVVVPPFTPLDNFFLPGSDIALSIKAMTPALLMNAIQSAKGGAPETIIRADTFNYIDPNSATDIIPTTWYTLIYGAAGNNIDSITSAITSYVLANSGHLQADWMTILPDLFKRTEFVMMPMWDNYSIPNRTLVSGIYSPITNLQSALALLTQVDPSYPAAHIDANATLMGHPYKSLSIMAIGSPSNKNNWFKLTDVFPDFIAIASTSPDFDRMSQDTQNWAILLANMLIAAENLTVDGSVPVGMTKMTRDGILYLVANYENIHYLVAAKSNFPRP